uniref:Amino acid transporter transmembrane domain-containing protein n=1 Tax=Kalanchoe fedtschenkoi TaxID=63787 RepID=A0A7N0V7V3_KALFE
MESQSQQVQSHVHQPSKGTSFLRTCFNGINALSGVGILSIPYALAQGGWLSLGLLFIVAVLCWYTGLLLQRCMDAHPRVNSYPDIGSLAFGSKGRKLVSLFMCLELYLVAVEFLILEGDNLDKLFPNAELKLAGLKIGGKRLFVVLTALVVLPSTWLRSLGVLAYVSFGGVVASVVLVVSVFWVGKVEGVGFHDKGEFVKWAGTPTSLSLFAFCYCGHAVFPTLSNSMKNTSQFSKVLLVCFGVSTLCYGSMAVQGYLMFGQNLHSQITLNLPLSKLGSKVAIYTTLINPLTKYAIMITPLATTIEEKSLFRESRLISCLIRTILVISTVFVALTVPFFGYMMAFIGAFLSVMMSMILPCLCYLKINKGSRSFGLELVLIGAILVIGSLVAVFGTYTSLSHIVYSLKHHGYA